MVYGGEVLTDRVVCQYGLPSPAAPPPDPALRMAEQVRSDARRSHRDSHSDEVLTGEQVMAPPPRLISPCLVSSQPIAPHLMPAYALH